MAPPESGPNSGGDLFDMAKDGTTVPEDSAQPRLIPSKARPDQYATTKASEADPNFLGGTNLAEAADNASDIPRGPRDNEPVEAITGTGDALPSQIGSKRLHDVPGGVVHDPQAKGSTRFEKHKAQNGGDQEFAAGEGPHVTRAPGYEQLGDEEAMDKLERKVDA